MEGRLSLKKIDSQAVLEEARKMGISPYVLMKRKINYRDGDIVRKCDRCINSVRIVNRSRNECREIGISESLEASIETDRVCDCFKNR